MKTVKYDRLLINRISSTNIEERRFGIELISSIHEKELYLNILSLLKSDDAITRNSAIEILTSWGNLVIELLIDAIKNEATEEKLYICNILGDIKSEKAVDALLALLADQESNIRFAAAEAIGKIGSKEATIPLLHYLYSHENDPWEQFPLILTLGQLGDERAVIPLLQLAENEMLRQPVLQAVSNIADEHAIPYIFEMIKNTDEDPLQDLAIVSIKKIRDKIGKSKINQKNLDNEIKSNFNYFSDAEIQRVLKTLSKVISQADYTLKLGSIYLLGLISHAESLSILFNSYTDDLQSEIQEALENIATENIDLFRPFINNPNLDCLNLVIRVLSNMKNDVYRNEILIHSKHFSKEVRYEVCFFIGSILDSTEIPLLLEMLDDRSIDVVDASINSLIKFPQNIVLDKIINLLNQTLGSEKVYRLIKTICNIEPNVNLDILLNYTNSKDFRVRKNIADALKKYPYLETKETLLKLLEDVHPQVREAVIRSMEDKGNIVESSLIKSTKDQDNWVRYTASKALSKQTVSENVMLSLLELLNDPVIFVRIAVIKSLGELKIENSINDLLRFSLSPDPDVAQESILALSCFSLSEKNNEVFFNILETQVESFDWIVRKAVAYSLGKLNSKDALNLLLRMLAQETEAIVDNEILSSIAKQTPLEEIAPLLLNLINIVEFKDKIIELLSGFDKNIIPYLQRSLDTPSIETRINILSVLSNIKDTKSLNILLKYVSEDPSSGVRKQALLSLNNFYPDRRAVWAIMWAANHDPDLLVQQTSKMLLIS